MEVGRWKFTTANLNFPLQASDFKLQKNHEKTYKPDSVSRESGRLLFICVVHCCTT